MCFFHIFECFSSLDSVACISFPLSLSLSIYIYICILLVVYFSLFRILHISLIQQTNLTLHLKKTQSAVSHTANLTYCNSILRLTQEKSIFNSNYKTVDSTSNRNSNSRKSTSNINRLYHVSTWRQNCYC